MNPPAVACLVLAGITSSVGAFYLVFHLKWRRISEHLPFALLCFAVAAYDLFCAGLYESTSVSEGIFWQRLQFATLAVVTILTIWFLELVTDGRISRIGWGLIAALAFLGLFGLAVRESGVTLSTTTPSVKVVRWAGRAVATYHESEAGIANVIGILIVYVAFMFLFERLYRAYRRDRSPYLVGIMAGQVTFFLGLLNDGLVADRVYVFFYVSEYAFLVVIMTMSYALLGRFVDLHARVDQLNASLEQRVAEALADVKVLRGLIPICASCKRIRDDGGFWTHLDQYLSAHSEAVLSHGICPECARKLYPEVASERPDADEPGAD